MALSAVSKFVAPEQFTRVAMDKEPGSLLVGRFGDDNAELFINPNDAANFGQKPNAWYEEWAYRTPEELIEALVRGCTVRQQGSMASGPL